MKNLILTVFHVALASLLVSSCGSGGEPLVDPSDANALSSAIVIPGATRVQGNPPASSSDLGAPVISGGADLNVDSGDQAVLSVDFDSDTGYENCYVQVVGADDYFLIELSDPTTSGTIDIPVNIPEEVDTGAFDLYTCIAGADGLVSNAVETGVGVTYSGDSGGGGGGKVICASENPSVGAGIPCPGGGLLDFCVSKNGSNCYYTIGGQQVNCGNCQDANSIIACAEQAAELCTN